MLPSSRLNLFLSGFLLILVFLGISPDFASAATSAPVNGAVNVLYCGSLAKVIGSTVDPRFEKSTHVVVDGYSGGSTALAHEIETGIYPADVFLSASVTAITSLEGPAGKTKVSWYGEFATSTLVLGYNPHSSFAQTLKRKPFYSVISQSGFKLGRTTAKSDPKGALSVAVLQQAARKYRRDANALQAILSSTSNIFTETALVAQVQSGSIDAGFFYAAEAKAAGIPTVPLKGVSPRHATYTFTIVNKDASPQNAAKYVRYLLSKKGQKPLRKAGVKMISPVKFVGKVPKAIRSLT
jgi:molybdate/tungstate transport system substrate-binding protein